MPICFDFFAGDDRSFVAFAERRKRDGTAQHHQPYSRHASDPRSKRHRPPGQRAEEFYPITTLLTGLMELTRQQLEVLSLVIRMPVAKLFGTPPRGFNATGENDEQNWAQVIFDCQTGIFDLIYNDMGIQ